MGCLPQAVKIRAMANNRTLLKEWRVSIATVNSGTSGVIVGFGNESPPTSKLLTKCRYDIESGNIEELFVLVLHSGALKGLKRG